MFNFDYFKLTVSVCHVCNSKRIISFECVVALKRAWNNHACPDVFKWWFSWSFPTWFYVLLDSDAGPTMSCNVQFHNTRSWPFLLHPITGDGIWCLQCHCSDCSWHLQLSCCRSARVGSSWRCHPGTDVLGGMGSEHGVEIHCRTLERCIGLLAISLVTSGVKLLLPDLPMAISDLEVEHHCLPSVWWHE